MALKFQSTIPYKHMNLLQRARIVVLMGGQGEAPEATSNVSIGVLVLRQGEAWLPATRLKAS